MMRILHPAMALLGSLLLVPAQPPAARQPLSPSFRDVPAAKLIKDSVRMEPGASTRGLEHVPVAVSSPDRRRIARAPTISTGLESRRSRIVITGPGRRRTTISSVVNYFGLTWSPDSSKIAFSEGTVVHIADSNGRTRQVIHTGPGGPYPGACFDLVWSDGGRTLSFTQVENAEQLDLSRPVRVVIALAVPRPLMPRGAHERDDQVSSSPAAGRALRSLSDRRRNRLEYIRHRRRGDAQ
jgi:hypothetical protein